MAKDDEQHVYKDCPLYELTQRDREIVTQAMKDLAARSDKGDADLEKRVDRNAEVLDKIERFMNNGLTDKVRETIKNTVNEAVAKAAWKIIGVLFLNVGLVVLAAWLIGRII